MHFIKRNFKEKQNIYLKLQDISKTNSPLSPLPPPKKKKIPYSRASSGVLEFPGGVDTLY